MIGAGVIRYRFALGIGANGIQERIGTFTASALSVSAGIGYKVIPGKLNIGAAGFNQGYSTGFMDSSAVWRNYGLPRVGRFGAGWSDTLKGVLPYTAAVDVVYRDEDKRIMVPLGVEVWPIQYLALRAGACINQGTELFNAGIGLRWSNFNFDAAFVTSRLVTDYEVKPLFGLTYYLGGQKNAAKKPEVIKTVPQNSSSPVISPVNSRTDSIQVIPPPAQPASITSETGTGVEKVDKTDEVESGNNLDRIDKSLPSDSLKTEEIRTETPSAIDSVIVK